MDSAGTYGSLYGRGQSKPELKLSKAAWSLSQVKLFQPLLETNLG